MDNASYHTRKYTKATIIDLGLSVVYNLPATPQLNAIEMVFAQIKKRFKLDHQKFLLEAYHYSPEKLVFECL